MPATLLAAFVSHGAQDAVVIPGRASQSIRSIRRKMRDNRPMDRRRPIPPVPALLRRVTGHLLASIIVVLAGCSGGSSPPDAATPTHAKAAIPVLTARVVVKTMPVRVRTFGTVEPSNTVAVKSRIDGEVTAVHLADGQDVARGQLLFELDARDLRAQVRRLEADLARDRAILENGEAKRERYRDLLAKGFVSSDAYDQIRTDADAARATVSADEATLASARVQLSYTRITAPTRGRAGKVAAQLGNTVKANDTQPMVTINTIAPGFVSFTVPEQHLAAIRRALAAGSVPVEAVPSGDTGPGSAGELTFIDNAVDVATGTIRLRARFANADRRLWPGQYTNVTMTLAEQANAVVVPAEAVQNGPKGQYVYVVHPDSTVEMRPVTVDRTEGEESVIASGLKDGETVVTNGQLRLTPGAKVAVKSS
ncbi:MAG: efflux RND transporter periplasmic adaptor subunit [Betaproteobacteria bacterium]|nr:efflux RND transporter periplasmic adaptor subunit [Betaproteobacteria bacterium]